MTNNNSSAIRNSARIRSSVFSTDDEAESDTTYAPSGSATFDKRRTSSLSNEQAKAILFNKPVNSQQLYFFRVYTDDETFSTILRKNESFTVQQLITVLQKKYGFGEVLISLENGDDVAKHLNHHDEIIKIQNELLLNNGVGEEELPFAGSKKSSAFRFLIHRL